MTLEFDSNIIGMLNLFKNIYSVQNKINNAFGSREFVRFAHSIRPIKTTKNLYSHRIKRESFKAGGAREGGS